MNGILHDIRHALRSLRSSPGFTLAAVVTLALGVGAATTIFSAVHAVLLARPPYPEPEQLMLISARLGRESGPSETQDYWSYPMFEAFRQASAGVGEIAAFMPRPLRVNLAGENAAEPVRVEIVSQAYFGILGVVPRLGRFFAPEEDTVTGERPVAVLSESLWRRSFGADPGIVGRTVRLNAISFTVVGIAPAGFRGLSDKADVWAPMMMAPSLTFSRRLTGEMSFWHMVIARIPRGTDPAPRLAMGARAVEERFSIAKAFRASTLSFTPMPLQEARTDRRLGRALLVLLGAVLLVLLIVCSNLASLHLARARRRRRELGVRIALGAGTGRLARQLFTESFLLAVGGGGAGLLLSAWGLALVNAIRPDKLEALGGPAGAQLNLAVFVFAVGVTVGSVLLFGLVPALWAARTDPLVLIRSNAGGSGRVGARGMLVAVQVALAVVLLTGAGLLVRTVAALERTPLGFEPGGIVVALLNPPSRDYPEDASRRLFREAPERIAALPGIRAAAAGNCLPLVGGCDSVRMTIDGDSDTGERDHAVWLNMIDEAWLPTLGIPLVAGRAFDRRDAAGSAPVALVTETAARRYWPGSDPIGRRIHLGVGWPENGWAEVVGVVRDVRVHSSLRDAAEPGVYLPIAQFSYSANYLVVQVEGDPAAAIPMLRAEVRAIDPRLPLWDPAPMSRHVASTVGAERFTMILLGGFGLLALVLAALGIYSVVAYTVAGRTREIGLRMALGARRGGVLGLVFRQAFAVVAVGLLAGGIAALGTTRVLRAQVYEVSPTDPGTLVTVLVLLAAVAAAAILPPAVRAARVAPVEVLREP